MSLVCYAVSSDEDSDTERDVYTPEKVKLSPVRSENGDDIIYPGKEFHKTMLLLPAPKQSYVDKEFDTKILPTFSKLPMPRTIITCNKVVELDDEFLNKKAFPIHKSREKPQELYLPLTKASVKIRIPSLKDFNDVDTELSKRRIHKEHAVKIPKSSGLLSILPKAKSEQNFGKAESITSNLEKTKKVSTLVPDSVKQMRPAYNTENVDKLKQFKAHNRNEPKVSLVDFSDSEASDDSTSDFFSLNYEERLPQISSNEINIMVAKRAAKMAEVTNKFLESTNETKNLQTPTQDPLLQDAIDLSQNQYHQHLDAKAIEALAGSNAKRRRKQHGEIQIMDISGDEVLPNRDEWMRTALATSTAYQPTGVLVDEEPASGTRRKHQITYLAHKAKANEAELQAMWAANRHARRATQSKYGF